MIALHLLFGIAWLAITGEFTIGNFFMGLLFAYGMLYISNRTLPSDPPSQLSRYVSRLPRLLHFIAYFIWSIVWANIIMLREVIRALWSFDHLQPAIIAIPIDDLTHDAQITFLASWITLTPGTLSLDVSADKRYLYIHALSTGKDNKKETINQFRRQIEQEFKEKVKELFAEW